MYNILIVDDEPLICKGLSRLLVSSGMNIHHIFTAHSGYEALDYIRMEEIHLLITDIQMGTMNGIELMHQAKMIKPWIQTLVISAHETFQYAQMAIRLGAKDYLIKPLNSEQFADSVRDVLLKLDKSAPALEEIISQSHEHFHMKEQLPDHDNWLNSLLTDAALTAEPEAISDKLDELHIHGPYFAVIKLKMDFTVPVKDKYITGRDVYLLRYATLNITKELLEMECDATVFYTKEDEISIIIQWGEDKYNDLSVHKVHHLELIGRSLHFNIHKYLHIQCVVGISQISQGIEFLVMLNDQAGRAIRWHQKYSDYYVFYYGDFNWSMFSQEPSEEEVRVQSNHIVGKVKQYLEESYAQKGLTIHEVAKKNHVSPNYLSYLFKKNTGYNLWEYVIKLRMEESKELIMTTDMRRYEIAEKVGYESPEHFSKIFKKHYGVSPSELKK